MNFRQFLESVAVHHPILLDIRAYTSGQHAFEDVPEEPAEDARKLAKWKWYIENPKTWDILKGKKIIASNVSFESYHEHQVSIHLMAEVDEATYAQIKMLNPAIQEGTPTGSKHYETDFIFTNFADLSKRIKDMMEDDDTSHATDHESSENYWKRMVQGRTMDMKRNWSGD